MAANHQPSPYQYSTRFYGIQTDESLTNTTVSGRI